MRLPEWNADKVIIPLYLWVCHCSYINMVIEIMYLINIVNIYKFLKIKRRYCENYYVSVT